MANGRRYGIAGILGCIVMAACACGPVPDYRALEEVDLKPPVFLGADSVDARTVRLRFDEKIVVDAAEVSIQPGISVSAVRADDRSAVISLSADEGVGVEYSVEATVKDAHGNSMTVLCRLYGFNSEVPSIHINEFINHGTSAHPDLVELYAMSAGDMAGVSICAGSRNHWDERFIFPPIRVVAGDYVLVHWKPDGTPKEINEISDKGASGGRDASPGAYDVWVEKGTGLSGTSGAISLYASPTGPLIDAVVYSNRTSQSDTAYAGFGSAEALARATELWNDGGWKIVGDTITPEDCFNTDASTSTRSVSRSSTSADTDRASDWHITPSRGATFGAANTDTVYVAAPEAAVPADKKPARAQSTRGTP